MKRCGNCRQKVKDVGIFNSKASKSQASITQMFCTMCLEANSCFNEVIAL